MQVFVNKQKNKGNFSNKSGMRKSSWNETGKSYKKNRQLLSKCPMCIKLAVGTLALSEIKQGNFDKISMAKLKRFVYQSNEHLLRRREEISNLCYKIL